MYSSIISVIADNLDEIVNNSVDENSDDDVTTIVPCILNDTDTEENDKDNLSEHHNNDVVSEDHDKSAVSETIDKDIVSNGVDSSENTDANIVVNGDADKSMDVDQKKTPVPSSKRTPSCRGVNVLHAGFHCIQHILKYLDTRSLLRLVTISDFVANT